VKADDSPVSAADREAEHAIVTRLAATLPDLPVIAEEAVSSGAAPPIGSRFLLVDPLDGTKEFISRNGEFTVNIALVEDGRPVLGVVLAPALRRAYAAAPGAAWRGRLDDGLSTVADWSRIATRRAPSAPVGVASRSHSNAATEAALRAAGAGDRTFIGSSLKFCILAEGEADFYPRLGPTMEWDIAAGDAVLRAAGGLVVTLDGEPLRYGKAKTPGMRPFENPPFLALGDPQLLQRLDLAAVRAHAA
jgi:3'(2'),5'-bisphosphate nucleotidase